MTVDQRRAAIARLRPRDLDVVRALLANPEKPEPIVADIVAMSVWTLRSRLRYIRAVLEVDTRAHLQAAYMCLMVGCDCAKGCD